MKIDNGRILVVNSTTLDYWLYLEYAKQVIRMKGPKAVLVFLGGCFMLLSTFFLFFFVSVGGIPIMLEKVGIFVSIFIVIMIPIIFLFGSAVVLSAFFPHVILSSRLRTKHANKFFTDSKGIKHKDVVVVSEFYEDKIKIRRGDMVGEIAWGEIDRIAESTHFYYLVLKGEIADPWRYYRAYIGEAIILGKNGFIQGNWDDLQRHLSRLDK